MKMQPQHGKQSANCPRDLSDIKPHMIETEAFHLIQNLAL